jgi:hypothetical protein
MKTFFLFLLLCFGLVSCKKNVTPACQLTIMEVSGNYHLTKVEQVASSTGIATDQTSSLTSCEQSGIYNFRSDGTATYTETTGCNGNGAGTWQLTNSNILVSFLSGNGDRINDASLSLWNCTNLMLETHYPSALFNNRYTLTKF